MNFQQPKALHHAENVIKKETFLHYINNNFFSLYLPMGLAIASQFQLNYLVNELKKEIRSFREMYSDGVNYTNEFKGEKSWFWTKGDSHKTQNAAFSTKNTIRPTQVPTLNYKSSSHNLKPETLTQEPKIQSTLSESQDLNFSLNKKPNIPPPPPPPLKTLKTAPPSPPEIPDKLLPKIADAFQSRQADHGALLRQKIAEFQQRKKRIESIDQRMAERPKIITPEDTAENLLATTLAKRYVAMHPAENQEQDPKYTNDGKLINNEDDWN